jgi:aspartate racemase
MAKKEILGIVGGMGPLASVEFVKTIYEQSVGEQEQASPTVLLHSDPTFPDRTQSLLAGEWEPLLHKLIETLNELHKLGASRIVICCLTIHYLLPKLPGELKSRIISLLDVIFGCVAKSRKRRLLIGTDGSRKLKVFEQHAQWGTLKDRIVMPDEKDQMLIHNDIIYQIKRNRDVRELAPILDSLLLKYNLESFIAGCTEIHLLAKHFISSGNGTGIDYIDPLMVIAEDLVLGKLFGKSYEAITVSDIEK